MIKECRLVGLFLVPIQVIKGVEPLKNVCPALRTVIFFAECVASRQVLCIMPPFVNNATETKNYLFTCHS